MAVQMAATSAKNHKLAIDLHYSCYKPKHVLYTQGLGAEDFYIIGYWDGFAFLLA